MESTGISLKVLLVAGGLLHLAVFGTTQESPMVNQSKPNILLILADDMGYSDLGFMGSEVATPNLDRLAADGTVYSHFMNHGKCEPTRASLMTGVHFHRQSHDHVTRKFRQVTTIADVLRKSGYFTACSGKWHLPNQPTDHGFDRYFGLLQGASLALNGEPFTETDADFYSTDVFTDYALQFLEQCPEDAPFFLYLAYTAPHWPLQAPESSIQKYEGLYQAGWEKLRDERHEGLVERGIISKDWKMAPADPKVVPWDSLSKIQKQDAARSMTVHAAMVDRLDEQIGRVIHYLEETGKLTDTLILFASDNGVSAETDFDRTPNVPAGAAASFRTLPLGFCNAVNAPYQGYKTSNANGGICSPFIAHWPGHIAAERIDPRPFSVLDIMPTLIEVADADYPTDLRPLDRKSVLSLWAGADYEPDPMYFQLRYGKSVDQKAVVQWPWKAWSNGSLGWSLYRLDDDGAETIDIKQDYPEQLSGLIRSYERFDTEAIRDQSK